MSFRTAIAELLNLLGDRVASSKTELELHGVCETRFPNCAIRTNDRF